MSTLHSTMRGAVKRCSACCCCSCERQRSSARRARVLTRGMMAVGCCACVSRVSVCGSVGANEEEQRQQRQLGTAKSVHWTRGIGLGRDNKALLRAERPTQCTHAFERERIDGAATVTLPTVIETCRQSKTSDHDGHKLTKRAVATCWCAQNEREWRACTRADELLFALAGGRNCSAKRRTESKVRRKAHFSKEV